MSRDARSADPLRLGAEGPSAPASILSAADSFRVRVVTPDGCAEARAFSRHLARFTAAVGAAVDERGADRAILEELPAFLSGARRAIARAGEGFPRLELWDRGDGPEPGALGASADGWPRAGRFAFGLALRPLPALSDTVHLRSAPGVRLAQARRKGPNIARLASLGNELGAEALLLTGDGQVLEGGSTSLLWWDGDVLCRVAVDWRVPSVVEALLTEAAGEQGRQTRAATASATELQSREVWAVNALHGLRVVASIDGVRLPDPDPARLAAFRAALDATWEPVDPPGAPSETGEYSEGAAPPSPAAT